jgi:hypothetical protein
MNSTLFEKQAAAVRVGDRELFQKYFQHFPQQICEMTFTNMLLWGESREHLFLECDSHLLTSFRKRGEKRMWYPPVGPDPARIIRTVLSPADGFSFLYLPQDLAEELKSDYEVRETPERFDYIYDLTALRGLQGAPYLKKRNLINRCRRANPEILPLTSAMAGECEALMERWVHAEERGKMESVYDEISALRLAFEQFDALRLLGVALRINGQMEAFALGAPLNDTMFVQHFEKASDAVDGLFALTAHEMAKAIPQQYTELNKEEDLGMPGLRMAKENWHPKYLVKKYAIG